MLKLKSRTTNHQINISWMLKELQIDDLNVTKPRRKQRLMSSFLFMWDLCAQCLYIISVHPVFYLSCLCVRRFSLRFVTSVCCSSGSSNGHAILYVAEVWPYFMLIGCRRRKCVCVHFLIWYSHFCCSTHKTRKYSAAGASTKASVHVSLKDVSFCLTEQHWKFYLTNLTLR